ncbi:MAG: signal peptidase I [Candidatus Pseudoruminococcus sp.]|uniref:signal peptidase I n=1 Tax=Candidatus Pseudoruminococcus sp. TaxID=3101048 RepID=UPI002A7DA561|nr:signal peptidase I [Ruminococcus sp.]MDY2782527.1 signal peptidase I [Candidatus Pseudoruminococcus sp.]
MSEEIKKTESLSPEENQETENVSTEEQKTEIKIKGQPEKITQTDNSKDTKTTSYGAVTSIFEWVQPLLVALVFITMLLTFVFRQVTVSGSSMYDTLKNGDRLIITNMFYEPQVGDIVVISHGQNYDSALIKRVIALEGQTLSINFETGDVVVDGVLLDEKYITGKTIEDPRSPLEVPSVIPEGYVYVMGDNREHSSDSRNTNIGLIKKSDIVGKAQFRIFPVDSFGSIY